MQPTIAEQAIQLLAAQITDPASVQSAYQEAVDMASNTQQAIEMLLKEQGEVALKVNQVWRNWRNSSDGASEA